MVNIVILTNTTRYACHSEVSNTLANYLRVQQHIVSVLDINSSTQDYQYIAEIKASQPDVLITLDLAGFLFRTQAGEIALNMLPTKNLNLIWGNRPEYAPLLSKKLSLSMLFYDVSGKDWQLPAIYPNLLYYEAFDSIDCFPRIWEAFKAETLL